MCPAEVVCQHLLIAVSVMVSGFKQVKGFAVNAVVLVTLCVPCDVRGDGTGHGWGLGL